MVKKLWLREQELTGTRLMGALGKQLERTHGVVSPHLSFLVCVVVLVDRGHWTPLLLVRLTNLRNTIDRA